MFNKTFVGLMNADQVYVIFNRQDLKQRDKFLKAGWVEGRDSFDLPCLSHKYYIGITNLVTKLIANPHYQQELTDKVLRDNVITEAQMYREIHHEELKLYCPVCKREMRVVNGHCCVCFNPLF